MNLVLFDLDNTLLSGDTDVEWLDFLVERGVLPVSEREANHGSCERDDSLKGSEPRKPRLGVRRRFGHAHQIRSPSEHKPGLLSDRAL